MPYDIKPLSCDPGKLNGLSEKLIVSHWENNYSGAVKRLNAIEQRLAEISWASAPVFEINGLKREELIASGSMILHEIYFDSLGGSGGDPEGALLARVQKDFGSIDSWRKEFIAMGKAQGGGSGWTLLAWSPRHGRLLNTWAADHAHNMAGAKAAAYVDAFMQNLSWTAAETIFTQLGV